jgi:hypothetical protein
MNIKNYTSEVPAERSILDLENELIKMGATAIAKEYDKGKVLSINFAIIKNGIKVPYKLPSRTEAIRKLFLANLKAIPTSKQKENAIKQAERTAWKNLKEWVQLQHTMIILEQVEFMEVFMPYMLNMSEGKTFFELAKSNDFKQLTQ